MSICTQTRFQAFTKYEMERANELLINPVNTDVDWKQMYFSLHTGSWINHQEANEFNPIHILMVR